MSAAERIHHLFNELHLALTKEADEWAGWEGVTKEEVLTMIRIRNEVDAAHHDFTSLTLDEVA